MSTEVPMPTMDWKDRISVMNLTLFLVIIIGLGGLVFIMFFKPEILTDPSTAALVNFFQTLILLAFGILTGKEVVTQTLKAAKKQP